MSSIEKRRRDAGAKGCLMLLGAVLAAMAGQAGAQAGEHESDDKLLGGLRDVVQLPRSLLTEPRNGEDAIRALGSRLKVAARIAGMPPPALEQLLRSDPTLWIGRDGTQFYVEPYTIGGPDALPLPEVSASKAALKPLADTFKLHSKPDAKRVIYLDFNGHKTGTRLLGTASDGTQYRDGGFWAKGVPFTSVPFDLDGNPATFNDAERTFIQRVWQGVSETFSPFDVDVTTEEPAPERIDRNAASDEEYGARILFTDPTKLVNESTGGIAQDGSTQSPPAPLHPVAKLSNGRSIASVASFGTTSLHDYYQPAFVFIYPNRFSGGSDHVAIAAQVAQTATHETGHNLGLRHDGNRNANGELLNGGYYGGHASTANRFDDPTRWAPIMGSGNAPVSQWSKLEYPNPNLTPYQFALGVPNVEQPDDYAVLASHGVGARTDLVGNDVASAASLGGSEGAGASMSFSVSGIIETPTDADCFAFDAGNGALEAHAAPAEYSPMLDIRLNLLNGNGQLVATASDLDRMDASISRVLAPGRYALCVEGTGNSKTIHEAPSFEMYSDYGSIGQYTLGGSYAVSNSLALVAEASATPARGVLPLEVRFSAGNSRDPDPENPSQLSYRWDFGDGSAPSSTRDPVHTYTRSGEFTATLTVTNSVGMSASASTAIVVEQPDGTPDAFAFPAKILAATNAQMQSDPVTISGINVAVPIGIDNGEYRIDDGNWTRAAGTVFAGQMVTVRHVSASTGNTSVSTLVSIGGVTATFKSTTAILGLGDLVDTQPDSFLIFGFADVEKGVLVTSAPFEVTGITAATTITVTNGQYSVNGGVWQSLPGVVFNKDTVRIRHVSATTGSTFTDTWVRIGNVGNVFRTKTKP